MASPDAAIIAGVGIGMYADFADGVRHTVQFDEPVMPDRRLQEYYQSCSRTFLIRFTNNPPLYDRWMR